MDRINKTLQNEAGHDESGEGALIGQGRSVLRLYKPAATPNHMLHASKCTATPMAESLPTFDPEARRRKAEQAATAAAAAAAAQPVDKAAPMSAAPMQYTDEGTVDWGNMWQSFCVLAIEGGPAHRDTLLKPETGIDIHSQGYRTAQDEIIRGIYLVSGLKARPHSPGWIAVQCDNTNMAEWLATAGLQENVEVKAEGGVLLVPCGEHYTLKGEIKNVITVVAKTTHYWADHIPNEVKTTMAIEDRLNSLGRRIKSLFGK